jgi:hypothetical protein
MSPSPAIKLPNFFVHGNLQLHSEAFFFAIAAAPAPIERRALPTLIRNKKLCGKLVEVFVAQKKNMATFRAMIALALAATGLAAPEELRITDMPGLAANLTFDQYSGYVEVDATLGDLCEYIHIVGQT